jgi:hypothetical protein
MPDIIDTSPEKALTDKQLQQALLDEQALIAKELQANLDVTPLPYNPNATVLHIPRGVGGMRNAAFTIFLEPEHCRISQLMFGVFNAAAYRYLMTDEFPEKRKETLLYCKHVWRYLDGIELTDKNRATWLKDFEVWRVSEDGVKTQSTGLDRVKLMIEDALGFAAFNKTLTDYERGYLNSLLNTSIAPREKADAVNLNQWLSQHTWLRRDDIGIGHELYSRLGSPKALMNSFRITIETAFLYFQGCKGALIEGFRLAGVTPADIPALAEIAIPEGRQKNSFISAAKAEIINRLREKLVPLMGDVPDLKNALELLVFAEARPQFRQEIVKKLLANQPITATSNKASSGFFTSKQHVGLFDVDFLRQLALSAQSSCDNAVVPVSKVESFLFSYLMAYQTVQGSDISKLTLRDFKFVRRVNGAITHIESDYFKGRAKYNIHQVETLKTKDDIGKAVLRYIQDVTALAVQDEPLTPVIKTTDCGPSNLTGLLFLAFKDTELSQVLKEKHQTHRVAPVFPKAMYTMLCHGVTAPVAKKAKIPCETALPERFFGFAHIKTSSVYAGSDTFDPTSLINPRSHTNDTERERYLVEMNQEWQNNCGRVTRAVMRDLYVNVFTASESDKQFFESEFTKAVEHIKTRADDVLACLKVVTEQTSGRVDALGLTTTGAQIKGDLPDTIYVQDSPETVLKFKHFLAQLEEKHALLRDCAPEFLFFTALPTAEWIASLLSNKKTSKTSRLNNKAFSKTSLEKGQAMYDKYRSQLPPHFTAQLS